MAIIECRASQAEPNMSCLAGKGGKLEAVSPGKAENWRQPEVGQQVC